MNLIVSNEQLRQQIKMEALNIDGNSMQAPVKQQEVNLTHDPLNGQDVHAEESHPNNKEENLPQQPAEVKQNGPVEVKELGIGGFDLQVESDRGFALDYNSNGAADHIVFYRPGHGTLWIIFHSGNGYFKDVLKIGDPGNGVPGYKLDNQDDKAFAFDYSGSGHLDHIVLYNSTTKKLSILRKSDNKKGEADGLTCVYEQNNEQNTGVIDLTPKTQMFAFDYTEKGRLDHLLVYTPGSGTAKFYKFHSNSN